MTDETRIARLIGQAKSGRQLRAAAGVTLTELSKGYALADRLPTFSAYGERQAKRELDGVRLEVEGLYKRLSDDPYNPPAGKVGDETRRAMGKAWNTIGAIRAGVGAHETWSGLDVLAAAVADAPRVFVEGVKATVGGAASITSGVATSLLMGLWPLLLILGVVAFLAVAAKKKGLV